MSSFLGDDITFGTDDVLLPLHFSSVVQRGVLFTYG